MSFPKVTIMIINYNGLRWLPKCLSSVTRTDYPDYDIYLVDNCSVDGSLDYVRKEFPNVKIINFDTNLGFAEAYNRAIDMVKADYIVLLNNDTEIPDPKWIENLIQEAKRDQRVAAVACKMVSMSFPSRLDSVGGMGIPYWRGFVDIGKEEYDTGQYDYENFEPFSFCGGAVLLNRESFIKLGGFDEKFFMYMEDVDLSWRMRLCKYRISFAPEAKVNHYYSGSTRKTDVDARVFFNCHKNFLRAILKNCGSSLKWALSNYLLFSILMIAGYNIYRPIRTIAIVKAILWNLTNLKNTYTLRLKIQSRRNENESQILNKMYPKIRRYQPATRPKLRHILNILFEYNQVSKLM